jgi:predicted enzyme related to lactoylglutathione lyase
MAIKVSWVMFDCENAELTAAFWSQLLKVAVASRRGPYVFLEPTESGLGLGFQRVESPQSGKRRIHLDLVTDDLDAAVSAVSTLGGRRAVGYDDGGFLVMLDPEDNEFCLLPTTGAALDDRGVAHYLTPIRRTL